MLRLILFCFLLFRPFWTQGQEPLTIASGAGYKKPLIKVFQAFSASTGIVVTPVFGNMRTVMTQTEQSGQIALAVGDRAVLSASDLFGEMVDLGRGRLVLAWADTPPDNGFENLLDTSLRGIAIPDPKKTIYGRAAGQFLRNSGLRNRLDSRLLVLATVPQVSSHLLARSVSAGFINLTDAMALSEHIGGYTEIPSELYEPIQIVAAVVKGQKSRDDVLRFIVFLDSPVSRKILREAGL
jgi:molybdate transport system substrate-binding protein